MKGLPLALPRDLSACTRAWCCLGPISRGPLTGDRHRRRLRHVRRNLPLPYVSRALLAVEKAARFSSCHLLSQNPAASFSSPRAVALDPSAPPTRAAACTDAPGPAPADEHLPTRLVPPPPPPPHRAVVSLVAGSTSLTGPRIGD
ncbi:uncharacterized protein LOC125518546 isoform X3 [Triticum urartu]|uniref:uncharacterized protein LOC125518546 isoform X3 n=1 Tax=Triticum urartu TaxID=4572 RepID=UPI0020447779|nr:uncharacterized protein LOC125518546 isoform X3 [Triticum urartu]